MPIHEQERAYKRGVVLGLTLAEVVILVVFSLLLLFAVSKKIESKEPIAEGASTERSIFRDLETMRKEEQQPLDKFWRELVRVYQDSRRTRDQARRTPSDETTQRRIISDMEERRGAQRLDEYWAELRREAAETQVHRGTIERLVEEKRQLEEELRRAKQELAKAQQNVAQAQGEVRAAEAAAEKSRKERDELRGHTWPPIIELAETKGFSFSPGDARLTPDFEQKLRTSVVARIVEYVRDYKVDVIEIVGHTDEQIMRGVSNLDGSLIPFLHNAPGATPRAADNAGLGMARAAAVTRFLRGLPELERYKDKIFPLSSAQVLDEKQRLSDGTHMGDVKERRRIEIRLRRSSPANEAMR